MIARGGEQAGHADPVRIEFQRIDLASGDAAQQHTDRLQATQRLQEQAAVAHRQVTTLDQGAGQFARQQHVPVPCGIGMTRGEQCRRTARRKLPQHVEAKLDERIDAADELRDEQFRHHPAEPAAVLQRVRKAIGEPSAIRQHHPRSIRRAHEVCGIELQQPAARIGRGATTRAEEGRIGIDQRRRHGAIGQQSLLPVQIGQHRIQQPCALRQPRFEHVEFRLRQRQRNRIESPRIGRRSRQQTGCALFLHHALEPPVSLGQHPMAKAGKHAEQAAPLRAEPPFAVHHLVARHGGRLTSSPGPAQVGLSLRGAKRGGNPHPSAQRDRDCFAARAMTGTRAGGTAKRVHPLALRRSSVRGCSRDSTSFGSAIGPGVWPNGKKRERRRASASFALTGKCS